MAADPADSGAVDESATEGEEAALERARRRRRLDRIFGEVLPEGTSDESSVGSAEGAAASRDAEIESDRPPHHGGH